MTWQNEQLICDKKKIQEIVYMVKIKDRFGTDNIKKQSTFKQINVKTDSLKSPLQNYIKRVQEALKQCPNLTNKFKKSYPFSTISLRNISSLSKSHRNQNHFQIIVSETNLFTIILKISNWLVTEFSNMNVPTKTIVLSSKHLIEQLISLQLKNNDELVLTEIIPTFPLTIFYYALKFLRQILIENHLPKQILNEYVTLTNLCVEFDNFFDNNLMFLHDFDTKAENRLPSFLTNLFMFKFINDLKENSVTFPNLWLIYISYVFFVCDTRFNLKSFIHILNNQHPFIKFVMKKENNNELNFLNVTISKMDNTLKCKIDRSIKVRQKQTTFTKVSAFCDLITRLMKTTINKESFEKELQFVIKSAEQNGYDEKLVCDMVKYLSPEKTSESNLFQESDNDDGTSNLHEFSKDKNDTNKTNFNKPGVYGIICKKCQRIYVGKTKRNISTRFKEHLYCLKNKLVERSAIAHHFHTTGHTFSMHNLKLLKECKRISQLKKYEAIFMNKYKSVLLNNDLSKLIDPCINIINFPATYSEDSFKNFCFMMGYFHCA